MIRWSGLLIPNGQTLSWVAYYPCMCLLIVRWFRWKWHGEWFSDHIYEHGLVLSMLSILPDVRCYLQSNHPRFDNKVWEWEFTSLPWSAAHMLAHSASSWLLILQPFDYQCIYPKINFKSLVISFRQLPPHMSLNRPRQLSTPQAVKWPTMIPFFHLDFCLYFQGPVVLRHENLTGVAQYRTYFRLARNI